MIQLTTHLATITKILFVLFGSLLLVLPSILNGFPFIFTDTLSYITSGIDLIAPLDRPIFYGLLIRLANRLIQLWGIVFFQAALLAFLLQRLACVLFPNLSKLYLCFWLIFIASLTAAPWFVGQISPDIFTSILFLVLIIWALTYEGSGRLNTFFIGVLITTAICVHSSNLLVGALTSTLIILWFICRGLTWLVWRKFAIVILVSFSSAIFLIISSNIWSHYGATLNPTGKVFVLARILEDGPGLNYLKELCKSNNMKTCAALPILEQARQVELLDPESKDPELKNLVASTFLWGPGLALSGGIFSVNSEAGEIIKGAIKTYPLEQFSALVRNMGNQLITFSVGEQLNSTIKLEAINQFFRSHFLGQYENYINSQQSLGKIRFLTHFLNPIYFYVVVFSTMGLLGTFLALIRSNIYIEKVSLTIYGLCVFLGANALVTGGLSGVFDRYQSRVIWLLPAICILLLLGLLQAYQGALLINKNDASHRK